ncbi:MAG: hypothetical protein Q8940_14715 [Bacteroidota bacterium]|nr:hypothetical protein [Bacteroidota bacterium]
MKLSNKKNIATIPLIIITFVLWSAIFYKVIVYFISNKTNESEAIDYSIQHNESNHMMINRQYNDEAFYRKLSRDPFYMSSQSKIVVAKKYVPIHIKSPLPPNAAREPASRPKMNYKMSGVIINNQSKLVMMEDSETGGTIFLREGDEYKGIEIKSIKVDKVIILRDKQISEISIVK